MAKNKNKSRVEKRKHKQRKEEGDGKRKKTNGNGKNIIVNWIVTLKWGNQILISTKLL